MTSPCISPLLTLLVPDQMTPASPQQSSVPMRATQTRCPATAASRLLRLSLVLPLGVVLTAVGGVAARNALPLADEIRGQNAADAAAHQVAPPFSLRGAWRDIGRHSLPMEAAPGLDPAPAKARAAATEPEAAQISVVEGAAGQQPDEQRASIAAAPAAAMPEGKANGQCSGGPNPRGAQKANDDLNASAHADTAEPSTVAVASAPPGERESPAASPPHVAAQSGDASKTATSALPQRPVAGPPLPVRRSVSTDRDVATSPAAHRAGSAQSSRRQARSDSFDLHALSIKASVFRDLDYTSP
jgi:hypothetical protein